MSRALRACVQLEIGECLADRRRRAEIGDNEGIDAAQIRFPCRLNGTGQLAVGHQRVQREIRLRAEGVTELDGIAHRLGREICRAKACVKIRAAEVDGVRARVKRRGKRLGRARGG